MIWVGMTSMGEDLGRGAVVMEGENEGEVVVMGDDDGGINGGGSEDKW